MNLAFFLKNACLLLMFDSEKYNPSCTVNFETIRGDFQYVKKQNNSGHLIDSCFHSVLIYLFLLFSSVSSAEFDSGRNLCCSFAQQHFTVSWHWHRQQRCRDSMGPEVQYRRAIHSEQSDEREWQPRLCSVCWCHFCEEKFLPGPAPRSVPCLSSVTDWFVAPAQGSNLTCLQLLRIIMCYFVTWNVITSDQIC